MDVEILIHGVPDGQDYFGIKNEQTNMELFYDSSVESVKFVVEIKKQGNQAYAYYSYLRYKNMIGAGGRPGSYFGLTLRLDMYYQDVMLIYDLLEIVFKKHIVGTLLAPITDGYKYTVPSFGHKKAEIENLQNALLQLLQTSCVVSKFLPLDKSFINSVSTTAVCNIHDITESLMLATIKKYSKVALSPDYPLNAIKEYEKKLKEADSKGGNLVAAKDRTIADKDRTINSLNTTISTQQSKIDTLEQENRKKDAEILQFKKTSDLAQLAAKIKDPIYALSEYFRSKEPQIPTPKYGYKNYILGISSCVLLVAILTVCVCSLFRTPVTPDNKELKELKDQVASLTQQNHQLSIEIMQRDKTIEDLQVLLNQLEPTPQPVITTLNIDVTGVTSGKLSPEKLYVVTVKNNYKQYNGKGEWTLNNAEIKRGKRTDSQITIKPNGTGKVTIAYKAKDVNCKCDSRSFEIECTQTNPETLTIEVSGFRSGKLIADQTYVVSIKSGNKIFNGKGEWILTNANLTDGKLRDAQITIQPNGHGDVVLEYKAEESMFICDKRTFPVQQKEKESINFKLEISPNVAEVIEDSTYIINVKDYDGDVEEWRYSGCSGSKQAKLSSQIKIDKGASEAVITFVPKGMKVEEAKQKQIKIKVIPSK